MPETKHKKTKRETIDELKGESLDNSICNLDIDIQTRFIIF